MTTTIDATLKVGIQPLRAAILSVVAHTAPARLGDTDLKLSRLRFIAGGDELIVAATDGATCALAAVTIEEDSRAERFAVDDGPLIVDMHPAKARDIARIVKPVKDDEDPGWAELAISDADMTVADVSGLWPGTALTVPLLATAVDYPDVPAIIGRALAGAAGTFKPLCVDRAGVFDAAAKAWGLPLMVEPTGSVESRGFVVICGDAFIGTLTSSHNDDNNPRKRDAARHTHMRRLGVDRALKAV